MSRMQFSRPSLNVLRWAASLAVSAALPSMVAAQKIPLPTGPQLTGKPNIVLIVADDLGYGELSCQGAKTVHTPNIDSIAANGVRFTDGYVSCPVCSPSRAGIISGRYQQRFGHEFNPNMKDPKAFFGLPKSVATLPRRMKEAGYATAMFGKWHLGDTPGYLPLERGFDRFWGFYLGGHNYRGSTPENPMIDGITPLTDQPDYLTDAISTKAASYVASNRNRPFFLMVTYNAVHLPVHMNQPRENRFGYIATDRDRAVRTMLAAMDDGVGQIIISLRKSRILDDTLVIFVSDNGNTPDSQIEDNGGFRDGKTFLYEGGIRVPMLMQWKNGLPAGQTYRKPVISLDLTATIMAAGGLDLSKRPELDGKDLRPYLSGANAGDPHDALFWRFGRQRAVRMGNYKLVQMEENGPREVYDLAADPAETNNIASAQLETLEKLEAAYTKWNALNVEPLWTKSYPTPATRPANGGDDEIGGAPESLIDQAGH